MIELLEKYDDHWYHGCNVDNDFQEGLILARDMKIIKRLPGQDKVVSGLHTCIHVPVCTCIYTSKNRMIGI